MQIPPHRAHMLSICFCLTFHCELWNISRMDFFPPSWAPVRAFGEHWAWSCNLKIYTLKQTGPKWDLDPAAGINTHRERMSTKCAFFQEGKHVKAFPFLSICQQTFPPTLTFLLESQCCLFSFLFPLLSLFLSSCIHLLSYLLSPTNIPSSPPSMDNSSLFLGAAVWLPAYCDFHRDYFRDHSHLKRELEPQLWREINHSHLILTSTLKHTKWTHVLLQTFTHVHAHTSSHMLALHTWYQ